MVKQGSSQAAKHSHRPSNHLGIVLVAYGNEIALAVLLTHVVAIKRKGDSIVVIDNHRDHRSADIAERITGIDTVMRSDQNIGFAAGCNKAAKRLPDTVDLILFLNPDVMPEPLAIDKLRTGGLPEWGAWMGLLILPDGRINSAGNIVHMSGLSWCDKFGQLPNKLEKPQTVDSLSGACMMVRKPVWDRLGGFNEAYFMYYEDTDLCMAMHHLGVKIGIVPSARFIHDYDFHKGSSKWFCLERNRYLLIASQWPLAVILLLAPMLCVCEIGLWLVSIIQGRFIIRLKAVLSFVKMLPQLIRRRRQLKQSNTSSLQYLQYIHPDINTPLLAAEWVQRILNAIFNAYYQGVRFVLGLRNP